MVGFTTVSSIIPIILLMKMDDGWWNPTISIYLYIYINSCFIHFLMKSLFLVASKWPWVDVTMAIAISPQCRYCFDAARPSHRHGGRCRRAAFRNTRGCMPVVQSVANKHHIISQLYIPAIYSPRYGLQYIWSHTHTYIYIDTDIYTYIIIYIYVYIYRL
jgi:hypothetical protein